VYIWLRNSFKRAKFKVFKWVCDSGPFDFPTLRCIQSGPRDIIIYYYYQQRYNNIVTRVYGIITEPVLIKRLDRNTGKVIMINDKWDDSLCVYYNIIILTVYVKGFYIRTYIIITSYTRSQSYVLIFQCRGHVGGGCPAKLLLLLGSSCYVYRSKRNYNTMCRIICLISKWVFFAKVTEITTDQAMSSRRRGRSRRSALVKTQSE